MGHPVEILSLKSDANRFGKDLTRGGVSVRVTPSENASTQRVLCLALEDLKTATWFRRTAKLLSAATQVQSNVIVPIVLTAWGDPQVVYIVAHATQLLSQLGREVSRQKTFETYLAPDEGALRRLVFARQKGAEAQLIASAAVLGRELLVWSCEPKLYRVPIEEVSALARLSDAELAAFAISESGSRIHWPARDIDVNMDTIREVTDPNVRREHEKLARQEAARYGAAIRAFRVQRSILQSGIAGVSEREVRRIEAGEVIPHAETLRKLAAANGMSFKEYVDAIAGYHDGKSAKKLQRKRSTRRSPG